MTPSGEIKLRWAAGLLALVVWICAFGYASFRDDIRHAELDPRRPFQTWKPPPAPDYARPDAWVFSAPEPAGAKAVDVFFVHPTTFNGGKAWSGAYLGGREDEREKARALANFAGPFSQQGRIFAPRYRQASLFAYALTRHDDARDARRFAYEDVKRAFAAFLRRTGGAARPIVLVGVEQGAQLVERLAREAHDAPDIAPRIVAVYLIEDVAAEDAFGTAAGTFPLCERRDEAGCVVVYRSLFNSGPDRRKILSRALVWTPDGWLDGLEERKAACVNPITGKKNDPGGEARYGLGGARLARFTPEFQPPLIPALVEARCDDGLLRVSTPALRDFQPEGDWTDRLKTPPFNLFYGDLVADLKARLAARPQT
jgi:hypothetical protein